MKPRLRDKIQPIRLEPGDNIVLSYKEGDEEKEVLETEIGRELTVNEAVIFDVEKGDFEGAQDGVGGAFLSCEGGK